MFKNRSPEIRLAILYLVVSSAWILVSDRLVVRFVGNNAKLLEEVQSAKGIGFVVLCSFLLYFASRSYYKRMKASLSQSEELLSRYKALGQATKEGIIDLDLSTDRAEINEQMQSFMQVESLDVEDFSMRHSKYIHPEDLVRVLKNFEDTLNTRANIWQADYRYRLNGGGYHDMISKGYIMRDPQNKPVRLIAAVQDVSEIRNMKSAMFHQELKHRQMLGQSIIRTQEEERNRWALELHDNVAQLLTVIKLYLEQISVESLNAPALVSKAKEMTEKALTDIRQLSASMKPPEFSNTSLQSSIQQLIADIARVKSYQFKLDFDDMNESHLKKDQKLMIFRVVQEQLNNIIKYGEASVIEIRVTTSPENVFMAVNDNGKGFDTSRVESGLGLRNIRSRLQLYAGHLNIDSAPGNGCRLTAGFSLV